MTESYENILLKERGKTRMQDAGCRMQDAGCRMQEKIFRFI
jgi:hypothetical protein